MQKGLTKINNHRQHRNRNLHDQKRTEDEEIMLKRILILVQALSCLTYEKKKNTSIRSSAIVKFVRLTVFLGVTTVARNIINTFYQQQRWQCTISV